MRRFGPSGSLNKKNNVLEHGNAVISRSSKDVFSESICILYILKYFLFRTTETLPLGLRLEPRQTPVNVFVIDSAERPTPD